MRREYSDWIVQRTSEGWGVFHQSGEGPLETYEEEVMAELAAQRLRDKYSLDFLHRKLLLHAGVELLDDLLENLEDFGQSESFDLLPRRFHRRILGSLTFSRRWLAVLSTMHWKLAQLPHVYRMTCMAEQLAFHVIVTKARMEGELYSESEELRQTGGLAAEAFGREIDFEEWEESYLEDRDHELLYADWADGIEDDPEAQARFRFGGISFEDWFQPFNEEDLNRETVHPYALEEYGEWSMRGLAKDSGALTDEHRTQQTPQREGRLTGSGRSLPSWFDPGDFFEDDDLLFLPDLDDDENGVVALCSVERVTEGEDSAPAIIIDLLPDRGHYERVRAEGNDDVMAARSLTLSLEDARLLGERLVRLVGEGSVKDS